MNDPQVGVEQTAAVAQGLLAQYAAIAKEAAQEIDAGEYSFDDRVKASHRLWELSVLGWVALTQVAISGPLLCGATGDSLPEPSEVDIETADTYERTIELVPPLRQHADPSVVIPPFLVRFTPDRLAAGATRFQMGVLDPNFSGFVYMGAVRLKRVTGPPSEVTVPVTTEL